MLVLSFEKGRSLESLNVSRSESFDVLKFNEQEKTQFNSWEFVHYQFKENGEIKGDVLVSGNSVVFLNIENGASWQSEVLLIIYHLDLNLSNPYWHLVGLHWPTLSALEFLREHTTASFINSPVPNIPFVNLRAPILGFEKASGKINDLLLIFLLQDDVEAFSHVFNLGYSSTELFRNSYGTKSLLESSFLLKKPKIAKFLIKNNIRGAMDLIDFLVRNIIQQESIEMLEVLKENVPQSVLDECWQRSLKFCITNKLYHFEFVVAQVKNYNLKTEEIRHLIFLDEAEKLKLLFDKYSIHHTVSLSYFLKEAKSPKMGEVLSYYHNKRSKVAKLNDKIQADKILRGLND